jgi:hypothetical protein
MSFSRGKSPHGFRKITAHPPASANSRFFYVRLRFIRPRPVRAAALSFCLFSFWLSSSIAAAEILIEPRVGFHGVFQLGRPFPLQVELSNSGRPTDGILAIRVWKGGAVKGGAPYPLDYRREVYVAAQSRKNIQLTVDPDFVSRPLTITFSSPLGKVSREVDLRRHFSPAPIILLAGDGNAMPPVFLGSASPNRVVGIGVAELPPDGRGLLGVSHLILYDSSLRDLSRSQLRALDSWLTAGGRMVILGSLNYALYQEPAISRFLPVRVTGIKRISLVSPLGDSERPLPAAEVWAQTSTLVRGKILAESQGVPVLVETNRGKGRITYLSVDVGRPPLSRWDGLPRLVRTLLAPSLSDDPPPRTRWDDAVFSQLIMSPSFASSYVPAGALLLAIIAYLGGIGLFAWLWQSQRVKPHRVAGALLGFVAVASAAGHLAFSRGGNIPDGVLLSSTVLENSVDGYAEAQSNVALFSTQTRQYILRLKSGWMEWLPVSAPVKDNAGPAAAIEDGENSSRFQLPLREWDYRLFRMRFMDRLALRAEFEQQGDTLLMKIDNRSAKDLSDCWLVVPGQRYALGDIARGANWTRGFSLVPPAEQMSGSSRAATVDFRDLPFKDKTHEILFHSSMFPRDEASVRWSSGAAVFFGWVKNPERWVSVEDERLRTYDYALFRTIIPLGTPEDE